MRLEKWYIPLLQSITDKINALASKRSFQRNGGEIMLVGVEGDILYGARTKYEWLALIEDIDRGVKVGVLKHRPKNRRFRFPEDFEEEVSDWAAKKGKHRVAIICSCPSRLGDDTAIMEQVRGAGGERKSHLDGLVGAAWCRPLPVGGEGEATWTQTTSGLVCCRVCLSGCVRGWDSSFTATLRCSGRPPRRA